MMKLFNLVQLATTTVNTEDLCGGLGVFVRIIKHGLFPILQIGIPIVLIVLGTIDLGKAVISSDEKQVKEAQGRLLKRCIYAVAIFFITTIVSLVMTVVANIVGGDTGKEMTSWADCWNNAMIVEK